MEKTEDSMVPQINSKVEIVVHAIRVLVKLGMILALYYGHSKYFLPLSIYIVMSEALDQISIYFAKRSLKIKTFVPIFYVFNSILVISLVGYFANWALNDFYLVYLIHISSATVAYGFRTGLLSFVLSLLSYSLLLQINQAPLELYLRLPLISVLILRLFVSERNFEKTEKILKDVLSIEKAKQDFITIASHNLRTPVAAIYGYIDLLARGEAGALNDQQVLFIQRIKNNNQELEKLSEQLLQISILEVGKEINLLKQPSQIELMIDDIVENFAPVAKAKGLNLSFNKSAGLLPLTNIDVEKIKTVILNLVDNAIKYTEKGSIVLTAKSEGGFIVVSVNDTGIGISQEEIPKIFNKFYRSGNLLVYNKTGTGLGLYIGKQIVELHGGKMSVDSTPGKGTTFTFTLPIVKEEILE